MKYYFIGGGADGQLREADPRQIKVVLPHPTKIDRRTHRFLCKKPVPKKETYIPMAWNPAKGERDVIFFMLANSIPSVAIRRLKELLAEAKQGAPAVANGRASEPLGQR